MRSFQNNEGKRNKKEGYNDPKSNLGKKQVEVRQKRQTRVVREKIPEQYTVRDYENSETSSKYDVKMKVMPENTLPVMSDDKVVNGEEKKNVEGKSGVQQLKSLLLQKDEDFEDNTKSMVKFYYHGKIFTYCKESCQLFKKEFIIRRLAVWITEWSIFQLLTGIMITLMAISMGLHNYLLSEKELIEQGGYQSIFSYTKYIYIAFFAIEFVLQIIAKGLYQSPNSYLHNPDNIVILVVFAIIAIYDTSFIFLLIFRVFYVFKFTKNVSFLRYSSTILRLYSISSDTLFKLFFLIFFFLTLFAILATNVWTGSFDYRCRTTKEPTLGKWALAPIKRLCGGNYQCPSPYYCGSNYQFDKTQTSYIDEGFMNTPTNQKETNYGITNFDNILRTFISLFHIYMVEGYTNIHGMMYDSHDAIFPVAFIVLYFLVCTYFLNDLTIAILFTKLQYLEAEEENKKKKQNSLVKFQINAVSEQGDQGQFSVKEKITSYPLSQYNQNSKMKPHPSGLPLSQLIKSENEKSKRSRYYRKRRNKQKAIVSGDQEDNSGQGQSQSSKNNRQDTQIEFLENNLQISKIFPTAFIRSSIKKRQITKLPYSASIVNSVGYGRMVPLSAIKGIRVLYFFTDQKKWKNYRILIDAMNHCISSVFNIMLIALAFMYFETIIGMWLFGGQLKFDSEGNLDLKEGISPRFNFDNILSAFTTVFTITQGDYWNEIWFDCVRSVGGWKSHPYFILITISGKLVFLNSFISIILNSFEFAKRQSEFIQKGNRTIIDNSSSLKLKKSIDKTDDQGINCAQDQQLQQKSPLDKLIIPLSHAPILSDTPNLNSKGSKGSKIHFFPHIKQTEEPLVEADEENQSQKNDKLSNFGTKIVPFNDNQTKKLPQSLFTYTAKLNDDNVKKNAVSFFRQVTNFEVKRKSGLKTSDPKMASVVRQISEQEAKSSFIGHLLKSSLFIFHRKNKFRILMNKLISSSSWNNIFLVHIILSSIQLAIDNPLDDPNSFFKQILFVFEIYFTSVFMLESVCNIIASGFIFEKSIPSKAYLRNPWNVLDIFINVTSIIDISGAFSDNSLKSIRSLRALRALRPLRVLTKNESLKLLVNALFKTLPLLKSLAFVTFTSTWIFAIFLMSQFKGKYHYCSFEQIQKMAFQQDYKNIKTSSDCQNLGGEWKNQDFNFDNIIQSIISLLKIIIGENWSILLWSSVDASAVIDNQPIKDNNPINQIYFFILSYMGNLFCLNLFTGLVVNNFKTIKDNLSGLNVLSGIQRQWVEMQKFMMKRKLQTVIPPPQNYYRIICYQIQKSTHFEKLILSCIIGNLVAMGCIYKEISSEGYYAISIINNTCLVIYHIEAIIKIMGVGFFFYFKNSWNQFDFTVLVVTDAVIFSSIFIQTSTISTLPIIFRAIRLGRIVKYIRASHSLKVLIDSVYDLLPSLLNIGALLLLLVSIFAILGMNLFSSTMITQFSSDYPYFEDKIVYPLQFNFQTIQGSFMVIILCVQNQNWDYYMSQYGIDSEGCKDQTYEDQQQNGILGCSTILSFPFFLIVVLFIRYIVINLFLALVIEGYNDTLRESEAIIRPDKLEDIIEKWSEFDPSASGYLSPQQIYLLLHHISEPIGLKNEITTNFMQERELSDTNKDILIDDPKNKHMNISKKKIFKDLKNFNFKMYLNEKTHFMDFCVKISRNAIIQKAIQKKIEDPYFIDNRIFLDDQIVEGLMKKWESEHPSLKKLNKRKDEKDYSNITVLHYFAARTIQLFWKTKKVIPIQRNQKDIKISNPKENTQSFQNISKNLRGRIIICNKNPLKQIISTNERIDTQNQKHSRNDKQDDQVQFTLVTQENSSSLQFIKLDKMETLPDFQITKQTNSRPYGKQKNTILQQDTSQKNQEHLKVFQNLHNFSIKKEQLGQKFPIKFATDYESLRPDVTFQPQPKNNESSINLSKSVSIQIGKISKFQKEKNKSQLEKEKALPLKDTEESDSEKNKNLIRSQETSPSQKGINKQRKQFSNQEGINNENDQNNWDQKEGEGEEEEEEDDDDDEEKEEYGDDGKQRKYNNFLAK